MIRTTITRKAAAIAAAVPFVLAIAASPAAAITADPDATALAAASTPPVAVAFTLDVLAIVQLLVAFVLPVLVGLVTTRVTSAARKAWYLAALSLLTSLLVELGRAIADGIAFDVGVAMIAAMPAFVVSVSSHYGLWKPTGVSAAALDVGSARAA